MGKQHSLYHQHDPENITHEGFANKIREEEESCVNGSLARQGKKEKGLAYPTSSEPQKCCLALVLI